MTSEFNFSCMSENMFIVSRRRTPFSEDDENNLCSWIAAVIPIKESGGRTGNKIYQELVSRVGN